MNWSLTTLSLPVIGDWGLSNVFSFLNIVKQFLILTCLVLCLGQTALHQYIEALCDFQYCSDETRLLANFDILIREKV